MPNKKSNLIINTSELEEHLDDGRVVSYHVDKSCVCECCNRHHIYNITGQTGPAGPTGPQGPPNGPTGPIGQQGVTGPTGPGVTGPQGPTGMDGQNEIIHRSSSVDCSTTSPQYICLDGSEWAVTKSGFYQVIFSSSGYVDAKEAKGVYGIFLNDQPLPESIKEVSVTQTNSLSTATCIQVEPGNLLSVKFKYLPPPKMTFDIGYFSLNQWTLSFIKGIQMRDLE